ncbi:PTS system, fructose-specific IIA component/PTS system, nitrogen regulatory IIA component [Seinonella peptonophila]|uniref:PTS system, fructose-specific IIA component/PTS system, nitrogen regulatory IIA component n=1 Tax=Seinonella peptonophila TaxID=112248 RepID=A0A1M4ZU10_9BACL|nr:PTS sugar transporter subunit IIA [Seinonella peptonophila]SHF21106.1 PTS system, fructose-specific IIA component/PTS system, nitrogen regulatory IIA component [Seinonella peptonophila]
MDLINQHLIKINTTLNTKSEIFETVCKLLEADNRLLDRQLFLNDLYEREGAGATAPGYSFAIPHAKSKGVKTASLVFIHLENEIGWTKSEKVKYIFAIAVPYEEAKDEHLNILAMLARKMMNEDFRKELNAAKTKEEYYRLLTASNV